MAQIANLEAPGDRQYGGREDGRNLSPANERGQCQSIATDAGSRFQPKQVPQSDSL
jgi:hypothetical protein